MSVHRKYKVGHEYIDDIANSRVYSGLDIINFLRELKLIENGRIRKDWLNEVTKQIKE